MDWLWPAPVTLAESLQQAGDPTAEVVGPTTVTVGDTFEVQVLVNDPLAAGVFGYEIELTWNNAATPVEATPTLSSDFPIIAQTEINEGQLKVTASREGEVEGLTGSLTLLTWTFQATVAPDLDAAHFDLTLITLGQKDGTALPLAGITNLVVTVVEPARQRGNLSGNVRVEGHAPGNQAGYTILLNEPGLTTSTPPNGDFTFNDVEFGVYTLTASSPGFLSATCTGLTHNSETTTLAGVTLLAGDISGDGLIDVADATALGRASSNTPDAAADLNGDGGVNVLDLILLAVNFGQSAADHPWVCRP